MPALYTLPLYQKLVPSGFSNQSQNDAFALQYHDNLPLPKQDCNLQCKRLVCQRCNPCFGVTA